MILCAMRLISTDRPRISISADDESRQYDDRARAPIRRRDAASIGEKEKSADPRVGEIDVDELASPALAEGASIAPAGPRPDPHAQDRSSTQCHTPGIVETVDIVDSAWVGPHPRLPDAEAPEAEARRSPNPLGDG